MLGSEPILTLDGQPITDRTDRRSYVTSAGSAPSLGKHVLMTYLPPEHAVEGTKLLVEYLGEQYPVTVARRRRHSPVRPQERSDPLLMDVLVCIKRVPMVRRTVRAHRRRHASIDTRGSGFPISPHEEIRGRRGRAHRRAAMAAASPC